MVSYFSLLHANFLLLCYSELIAAILIAKYQRKIAK